MPKPREEQNELAQPRVREAYREILRFISANGLREGDILPTQEVFSRSLAMSHTTLTKAMKCMVDDGLLCRRQRVGTVVENLRTPPRRVWSVGVIATPLGRADYRWVLEQCLRNHLLESACEPYSIPAHSPFLRGSRTEPPGTKEYSRPFDALIGVAPEAVVACPVIHIGFRPGRTGSGVVIDTAGMVAEACGQLQALGCRRLALLHGGDEPYRQLFRQELASRGLPLPTHWELVAGHAGIAPGQEAGRVLQALAPAARPDGILTLDDHLGVGLTDVIRDLEGYRPPIVVLTHRQLPRLFGVPVIRLEIDIDRLASEAVEITLEILLRGPRDHVLRRYEPTLCPTPTRLPEQ